MAKRGSGRGRGAPGGRGAGSPTRSSVDRPPRKVVGRDAPAEQPKKPSSLRLVRGRASASDQQPAPARRASTGKRAAPAGREHPARRRRRQQSEALDELGKLAGRARARTLDDLARAADAYAGGREKDAARILRPLRDSYPAAAGVRELLGLALYQLGNFAAAARELDTFVELTGSVEQHPVLMDCARAARDYERVDDLWSELAATSPSAELVTEGRIVLAGALADQGRVHEAIALLEKRGNAAPRRVREHHLRLWYALADLYERAGETPRARELFMVVATNDAEFADVRSRLRNLS